MQPFFRRTRATMISWPTTNCRCNSGFNSSRGMVCHGMYWCSTFPSECLATARRARVWDLVFDFLRLEFLVFTLFAIGFGPFIFVCLLSALWPNTVATLGRADRVRPARERE